MENAADSAAFPWPSREVPMPYPGDPEDRMGINYEARAVFERLPTGAEATYYLEPIGSSVRVARVVVTHPGRGVSNRDLRAFSPALAVEMFEKWMREDLADPALQGVERFMSLLAVAHGDTDWLERVRQRWSGWERALDRLLADKLPEGITPRQGRLLATAAAYAGALARDEKSPIAAAARYLERPSTQVVEDVRAARRAGFLTDAPGRGMSGGELTDEALRLLDLVAQ